MKLAIIFLLGGLASSVLPPAWGAPLGSNDVLSVRGGGSNSLATFQTLITSANFNLLGFHSTNELAQATNGQPLLVYSVPLSRLQSYLPGQNINDLVDPEPLQNPPREVIVPIMVGTNVRSSTTLRFTPGVGGAPGTWATANWGQPKLIRSLMTTYQTVPTARLDLGTVPFVVELPVFDIWLIGYHTQNKLVLRATVDMPLGPITILRNQIVTEAALFRLATAAQHYNGLPN